MPGLLPASRLSYLRRVKLEEAVAHVAKLVSGRDKTVAQVRVALERKQCPDELIEAAIARAQALGYLDDARVAVRMASDALSEGWVGEALVAKLEVKGFDPKVLGAAIAEARRALDFDDATAARRLLQKKRVDGPRAARFLVSRGFSHELVERLVGTLGADG